MNLAAVAIEKKAVTYFGVVLLVIAGIAGFFSLGQLEDPEYTVKTALIVTPYPGASPTEVELEVTDRIELALQELKPLDYVESYSSAGLSVIKVEIQAEYWADALPQIWDELRRKIRDVGPGLPPGVGEPIIADDFGDVFGFQLAVIGNGYSYAELETYVKSLRKELSVVEGVARVDLWGVQDQVIYLDVYESQLAELGLSDESIANTLRRQNLVADAGHLNLQDRRLRIAPSGEFRSPEDIGNLTVRPSLLDSLQGQPAPAEEGRRGQAPELIRIRDISTVRRGYREPALTRLRYNGLPALGISITNVSGANIVDVGRAIDQRLAELIPELPIGIEVQRVHWQSEAVAEAVNGFLINFAEAVAIVLVVLTVGMGWRMGVIIGSTLIVTILTTFMLMAMLGIDLQRMSLGALIIALGMMVDNAIVVADGMMVRLQQGMDRTRAAIEAASKPAWPLLGATVIAVMAFYPIFASPRGAGEYCRTLFTVVAISLLVSWVISVTLTPLQCIDLLRAPKPGEIDRDPYAGGFYRRFRGLLAVAIRGRWLTLGTLVALLVVAVLGFGNVKQLFFPASSMPKFMIDYWAPPGTRIEQVAADVEIIEARLLDDDRVQDVATFIGGGPPRFYLPVDPEFPNPSYAQLVVSVDDFRDIDGLIEAIEPWLQENLPQGFFPIRKYGVGPTESWQFELRFSGPAVADAAVLRGLGEQALAILEASPLVGPARLDWRGRVATVVPEYSQERGRWAAVNREDVARTTKRAFDGLPVGLYRERDELIPIVLRHVEEERRNVIQLDTLQVKPALATHSVPLAQVSNGVRVAWEESVVARRDRRRTLTVQANPIPGVTLPALRNSLLAQVEAIEPPPGYRMEWGGEHESSVRTKKSLTPGVVPAVIVMLFVIVALFNAFRPLLVILLTIPFAVIGITVGLLATDAPFGFVALLGAMSLSGMMIKNAIVLLDEIDVNLAAGKNTYEAVVEAAVSRLRPVVLAAATTVLGVIPLLQDPFWTGMAVTIMAGLAFGTLLTMILVPVLYAILYRVRALGAVE